MSLTEVIDIVCGSSYIQYLTIPEYIDYEVMREPFCEVDFHQLYEEELLSIVANYSVVSIFLLP